MATRPVLVGTPAACRQLAQERRADAAVATWPVRNLTPAARTSGLAAAAYVGVD